MSKASKGNKLRAAIADEEAADGSADGGVNLSPDTWARMSKLIDTSVASKIKEYTEQTTKSFNSVNLKLVDIGKRIEGLQGQYQTEIDSIRARLEDPDVSPDEATGLKIKGLGAQIDLLLKLRTEDRECDRFINYHHLCQAVKREQRQRCWSLRIYGFQSPWRATTPDVKDVYEEVIEPVLRSMIQSGDSVAFNTSFYSNIEFSHPLGPSRKGAVPPMIFRFFSRRTLFLFMLNKREHLISLEKRAADRSQWSSAAAAVKYDPKVKLRVSHDLADMNRQVMSFLHTAKLAHKCKTTSAGVSFMPLGHKGKWIKIHNPFSPTVLGMVEPLPELNSLLSAKSIVLEAFKANVPNKALFDGLDFNLSDIIKVADQHAKQQRPEEDGGVDPGVTVRQEGGAEGLPPTGGAAPGADAFPALPSPHTPRDDVPKEDQTAPTAIAASTRAAAAAAAASTVSTSSPTSTAPTK